MLKSGGYASITDEASGKVTRENDTFTCGHGNEIVRVSAGHLPKYAGGILDGHDIQHCMCCRRPLCPKCAAQMNRTLKCVPFEKRLERMERSDTNAFRDGIRRRVAGEGD